MVSINRAQHLVLQWVATGDVDPPSDEWKLSARALANRKLVTISRKSGTYVATITEAGQKYLRDHPTPPDPKPPRQPRAAKPPAPIAAAGDEPAPPAKRVNRKRHSAVRSLSKHRGALPHDREAQQRAIDAADALVDAALAAGFKLEGHEQPTKSPITDADPFTGCSLVTIIADHVEVKVAIGEQLKRVPHELTSKEEAAKSQGGYFWARQYDYIRTGKTFFRIKASYDSKKWLETERKPLADYVPNVIAYIQRQEDAARERKEAAERAAKEQAEREERARILAARRKAYDGWEKALTAGFEQWDKLQRLRHYVDALEAANDSDEVRQFVRWARGHVEALDPVKNFQLSATELPDLSHHERAQYGEYQEPTHRYGYGW